MKPTFIQSKGEANRTVDTVDTSHLVEHYRTVCRGLFDWQGLPEDMPRGYIEDTALFYSGGVSMKEVTGIGPCVLPCNPVTLTVYGTPYAWLPDKIQGITAYNTTDYLDLFEESTNPVLWMGCPRMTMIKPWLDIMSKAMKVLGVNITSLSQPVLIAGRPSGQGGDNIEGILLKSDISAGESFIPVVDKSAVGMEVLDLKATDNTQNLISTIQACDTMILDLLCANNGVEKSSGVSALETAVGVQSIEMDMQSSLERREEWCEKINAVMGTNVTVQRGKATQVMQESTGQGDDSEEEQDDSERLPVRSRALPQGRRDGGEDERCRDTHVEDPADPLRHRRSAPDGVRSDGHMIEIPSPQTIKECFTDDDGNPIDCFEDAVPSTNKYRDMLVKALWARWRYACISSLDIERWLQMLSDRAFLLDRKWTYVLDLYNDKDIKDHLKGYRSGSDTTRTLTPQGKEKTTVTESGATTKTTTKDLTDTETGTRTIKDSGTEKNATSGTNTTKTSGTNTTVEGMEALPATAGASASEYLTDRKTTTDKPDQTTTETPNITETRTPDLTRTETPNLTKTQGGTETVTTEPGGVVTTEKVAGISKTDITGTTATTSYWDATIIETVEMMKEAYRDPYVEYAEEFADLFINRWGGCCCDRCR